MRRRKKKSHVKLMATLLTTTLVIILIAVAIVMNQGNQTTQNKPKADKYLKVEHTKSLGRYDSYLGKFEMLSTLGLNITAVGGDASNVTIEQDTADDFAIISQIKKGNSSEKELTVNFPLEDEDGDGLYEVYIEISCTEAERAEVKVLIDPEDLVIAGG